MIIKDADEMMKRRRKKKERRRMTMILLFSPLRQSKGHDLAEECHSSVVLALDYSLA